MGGVGDVARLSVFFCFFFVFFQKNPSLNLLRGEGKGGLTSVSEFVLQRIQI